MLPLLAVFLLHLCCQTLNLETEALNPHCKAAHDVFGQPREHPSISRSSLKFQR